MQCLNPTGLIPRKHRKLAKNKQNPTKIDKVKEQFPNREIQKGSKHGRNTQTRQRSERGMRFKTRMRYFVVIVMVPNKCGMRRGTPGLAWTREPS